MKTTGVIAEFNPFHNGHEYLLNKAREITDADYIAVIMSGAFVQRGEPAVLSKAARVEQALLNGADLVLELPVECATSSAQGFARGAVGVLAASGVVNNLCFGSESGDVNALRSVAKALALPDFDYMLLQELKSGKSYPAARSHVLYEMIGDCAKVIEEPNNLLGIEYILAIEYFGAEITPYTVVRNGVAHDSQNTVDEFMSASMCRESVKNGASIENYVPKEAFEIMQKEISEGHGPVFPEDIERAVIAQLRCMTVEDFKRISDVSEGLEYLLFRACRENSTIDSVITAVKSKRYTYSRIKRILLRAYLGLTDSGANSYMPEYIRILGMKKSAAPLVKKMRCRANLPIIQRLASEYILSEKLNRELIATDIWGVFSPDPYPAGEDYRSFPVIVD